jgi:hypothetical protein
MPISNFKNPVGDVDFHDEEEATRKERYKEYWRFYLGKHWEFERDEGEPLVTVNLCRAFVDASVAFFTGKSFKTEVPTALEKTTLPILKEVWEDNNKNELFTDLGLQGAITGDGFVLVTFQEPTDNEKRIFKDKAKGRIRILLLDSRDVTIYRHKFDPKSINRVEIVHTYFEVNEKGEKEEKQFVQIISDDFIVEQDGDSKPQVYDNPYGEIPLVHVKNLPYPTYTYGIADIQDMIPLNKEINEKLTDTSDIINYQGSPITLIFGAKVANLVRDSRTVWSGLPTDAKVENLELETDLGACNEYLDKMMSLIHMVAKVPEEAMGKIKQISNTSAAALNVMFQPLIQKTSEKKALYEPALQRLNYLILRTAILKGWIDDLPLDLCKNCGGRILKYEDQKTGEELTRCFEVDPTTFEFIKPEEMEILFVRQLSYGNEVRKIPFKQIKKEVGKKGVSYWDKGNSGKAEDLKIISPALELPSEPIQLIDDGVSKKLIPTDCKSPDYLNPYTNKVTINSTLPRDAVELANLLQLYLANEIISRRTAREQVDMIEDIGAEEDRVRLESLLTNLQTDIIEEDLPPEEKEKLRKEKRDANAKKASDLRFIEPED